MPPATPAPARARFLGLFIVKVYVWGLKAEELLGDD
jgi:hypothetical protein